MKFEKYNKGSQILAELHDLGLPEGSYMVMGSGILDVLGIREADDIDLVVTREVYEELREAGWAEAVASNGSERLEQGMFQVYNRWLDETKVKSLEELIVEADWVHEIAFNSLSKLAFYKRRRGRDKDLTDLHLIQNYLDETS